MSEALQQLLRQAELQKLQLETSLMYQKNLALFKERFRSIYQLFEKHQSTDVQLAVDNQGNLNLINQKGKHYVYNSSPAELSKKQVDRFSKHTKVRKFRIPESPVYNPEHLYIPKLNEMVQDYQKYSAARENACPQFIVNLMLSGIGLGYQIPMLLERFDIQHLFLYENCKDTFHASLHVIDWQPILDYFRESGRSITFCIGVDPRKALAQVEFSIRKLGLHTHMFTFVFQHSQRKEELDFIKIYESEIRSFIGGVGYFDDEQIGLGHAYHNLRSDHAVFKIPEFKSRFERLAVVANGPSLDNHLEYLKQNSDKILILSCGSALGSLYRAGITPDFHVEMERDYAMTDYIKFDTPAEFRKNITLLCLHSVAPETLNQFGDACYAVKVHDAGARLIHDYYKPQKLVELAFCNPTVSNCALAFAVYMGFSNIHLIGTDFGIPDDSQHHSKNSLHYQMEQALEDGETFDYSYSNSDDLFREANFGGTIKTHQVLDISRVAIERLLDFAVKKTPEFTCHNSNKGAKIRHAMPVDLADIDDFPVLDKPSLIKQIKQTHFHHYTNSAFEKITSDALLKKFYAVQASVKLREDIPNDKALVQELDRITKTVSEDYDPITHQLLRGSLSCFFGSIVENSLYATDPDQFQHQLNLGRKHYNRFIDLIYERARAEPFKVDDFPLQLLQKMREKKGTGAHG